MKDRLQILLDYTNLHELIWDALRDLAPFVQFKKRENVHGRVLKVTLLHGCFSLFLNGTNGSKSSKASHLFLLPLRIPLNPFNRKAAK